MGFNSGFKGLKCHKLRPDFDEVLHTLTAGWYTLHLHTHSPTAVKHLSHCDTMVSLQWKTQQYATVYQNFIIPYFK